MTITEVKEEFDTVLSEASGFAQAMSRLDDVRYCQWPGQSPDGRKYSRNLGKQAFPWEGASDVRPYYVDSLINQDVTSMQTASTKSHMQVVAANSNYDAFARATTTVLDYVARSLLAQELDRERELAANWRQHYGSSAIGIDWLVEFDSEPITVTMQDLMAIASQDQEFGALMQYVMENVRRLAPQDLQAAAAKFSQYFPEADSQRALPELLQTGQFTYFRSYLRTNRPTVTAYRVYQDLFFPKSTCDIQRAPWIVRRDVLPKTAVEDRAQVEQWNPAFAKFVIRSAGESVIWNRQGNQLARYGDGMYWDDLSGVCEVFYGFYRGRDQSGNRQTQVCIFHPATTVIGRQLPMPYLHGKMPFVVCRRETRSRSILESRGIGDIAQTAQSEIKIQRDARNDRTAISVLPPLCVPLGRGKTQYKLGPASQLRVLRPGELQWLNVPPTDASSQDAEMGVRRDVGEYMGHPYTDADPTNIAKKQQRLVDAWLAEQREVCTQLLGLCWQFYPAEKWREISGVPDLQVPTDRQTVQDNLRVVLEFDARDLDTEYVEQKINLINSLISQDAAGILDRAALTEYAVRALDPALAQRLVRPQGEVTAKEVQDEQHALSAIVSGVEPPIFENGQNPQLRLQVVQQTLQNKDFQTFISNNPLAQQRLENRVKNFQFQIQQQQNATIGRLGTPPTAANQMVGTGPAPTPQ